MAETPGYWSRCPRHRLRVAMEITVMRPTFLKSRRRKVYPISTFLLRCWPVPHQATQVRYRGCLGIVGGTCLVLRVVGRSYSNAVNTFEYRIDCSYHEIDDALPRHSYERATGKPAHQSWLGSVWRPVRGRFCYSNYKL